MTLLTLAAEPWADHALLDSGDGRKLERYGPYRFIRPEMGALWRPAASWEAEGEFVGGSEEEGGGRWRLSERVPAGWELSWEGVRFLAQCTPFRHLAFFPDMAPQWAWMRERIRPGDEVLNLFGYTGVASLVLARAGARVTHVDASKKAVAAGRDNAVLNGVEDIRWIVDDAAKFVDREGRRGRRYAGVILDPPKFGRGPGGETWTIETGLASLVEGCAALMDERSRFLVLTAYAIRLSALSLGGLLGQALAGLGGRVEAGEMGLREEARGLVLPTAIFARWFKSGA